MTDATQPTGNLSRLQLGGRRGNTRWRQATPPESMIQATFIGGPRHGRTLEVTRGCPQIITVPSPEGMHAYEQTSWDELSLTRRYKYKGIIEGSEEPEDVALQLVSALASIAEHVRDRTALSPGSIMLPESVFPDARQVLGLEIVRGNRVALLLELL